MTVQTFHKDKYALVIDLRSHQDNLTGHSRKVVITQSGALLEVTKRATTANVMCKIFVVSDGLVNIVNNGLKSIQY